MLSMFSRPDSEKGPVLRLKSFSLSFGTQIFKALGDESRIRLIYVVFHRPDLTITDLELILDFTQTKTARLMGMLKTAGLVQSQRREHWVFYKIKEEAADLLADLLAFMEKEPRLQQDLEITRNLDNNRELVYHKLLRKQYKPAVQ